MMIAKPMYHAWHDTSICHDSRREHQTELDARLSVTVGWLAQIASHTQHSRAVLKLVAGVSLSYTGSLMESS